MMPSDHHQLLADELARARAALVAAGRVTPRLLPLLEGKVAGVIEFVWPRSIEERLLKLEELRNRLMSCGSAAYSLSGEVRSDGYHGLFAFIVDGDDSLFVDQEIIAQGPIELGPEEWAGTDAIAEEFLRLLDRRSDDIAEASLPVLAVLHDAEP